MKNFVLVTALLVLILQNNFAESLGLDFKKLGDGKYVCTYEEHYYDGVGESVLTIQKYNNGYLAVWDGITDRTEVYTDLEFNTQKMVITDQDTDLTVEREGALLKVYGFDAGKSVKKELAIKLPNWYQILPFSLIPFSISEDNRIEFSLFDPYNLKVRNMKITKKGTENITVFGGQYTAIKMSMRMSGLLSPFWKSEIWNSTVNGTHLKYEGLNVVPSLYKARIFLKKVEFLH